MTSTANRVIKNTGFLYARMGITMFISLYTTRLILNSLGASDFGIFNIVGGAIAMLGFLNAAMASATQRFMSYSEGEGNKEKQKNIFNISFVLHFFLAFIVGLVLLGAGYFFFNGILNIPPDRMDAAKVVYGSLIISTMFTVMTVPYDAVMNAHENMKYYAIVGVIESLLKLAVAFATVYTMLDKLIVYGILMACIPLLVLTIMRVYSHKHYEECVIAPRTYFDKPLMREMTSFAGWNLLGSLITIISSYGIGIVLNVFWGTAVNAAQGIANQVSGQLGVLGTSLKKALNPIITKNAGANNNKQMISASNTGTKLTFFIVTIFFIPVLVDAEYILKLWLRTPPSYTFIFCKLLLIANVLQNITLFMSQAIASVGKIKGYTIASSIIGSLPIILTYIFFMFGYPPYYMYITMLISAFGRVCVDLYYGQRKCNIVAYDYIRNVIIRLCICFVISYMIGYSTSLFLTEGLFRFALIILLSSISYCSLFYLVGFDNYERTVAKGVIHSIKNYIK